MNVDKFGLHLFKKKKHDTNDSATKGYVDKSTEKALNKLGLLEQLINELALKINNLENRQKNEQSGRRK